MKTILALIAVAMLFAGQAFADDGLEGIADNPTITQEQLDELLGTTSQIITLTAQPCYHEWEPKKNITAYELALCMKALIGRVSVYELPNKAARHFREVCQ